MEEITKKVDEYGRLKKQESELKKKIDKLNKEIKTYMGENNLDEYKGDDFTAKYTLTKKEDFDYDRLITLFKDTLKDGAYDLGIIKSKEYVDMDAVEKETYSGNISKDILLQMNDCKIVISRTPKLTISQK